MIDILKLEPEELAVLQNHPGVLQVLRTWFLRNQKYLGAFLSTTEANKEIRRLQGSVFVVERFLEELEEQQGEL